MLNEGKTISVGQLQAVVPAADTSVAQGGSEEALRVPENFGQLVGAIAHELNDLLTVILGYGQYVVDNPKPVTSARQSGVEIINAAERASRLSQALTTLSTINDLPLHEINLLPIMNRLHLLLRVMFGDAPKVNIHVEPDTCTVLANETLLERMVTELCLNARNALRNGGSIGIRIENASPGVLSVDGGSPAGSVMLSVQDDGEGMSPEVHARCLEPFFTTGNRQKNRGLGLAIVAQIVRRLNGQIEVVSQQGRGTTVLICMPALGRPRQAPFPDAGIGRVKTALVVDDNESLRVVLVRMLRTMGFNVLDAADGEQGLALAGRYPDPLHVVVTDVKMPRMDGVEMVRRLWKMRQDFQVLFCTGSWEDSEFQPEGFTNKHDVLKKPFTKEMLRETLERVLARPAVQAVTAGAVSAE
jgi:two-component system, cell cycle sensor histidine kinase and response regulator CckA